MGARWVFATKILLTPQPNDQVLVRMPAAPAASSLAFRLSPARETRCCQARRVESRPARNRSTVEGRASSVHFSSGRQVGSGMDVITNFPRACGSQALNEIG